MTADEYIKIQHDQMLEDFRKHQAELEEKDKQIAEMSSWFSEREKEYKDALKVKERELESTQRLFAGYFIAFWVLLAFIFALWIYKHGHLFGQ